LKYHYGADELHALWDILMYSQHNNIARPIEEEEWVIFSADTVNMTANG